MRTIFFAFDHSFTQNSCFTVYQEEYKYFPTHSLFFFVIEAAAFFMDYSISGENEAREEVFLTESNKSPGSISKSNNQGNLLASGEVQAPSDKLRSTYSVMSK